VNEVQRREADPTDRGGVTRQAESRQPHQREEENEDQGDPFWPLARRPTIPARSIVGEGHAPDRNREAAQRTHLCDAHRDRERCPPERPSEVERDPAGVRGMAGHTCKRPRRKCQVHGQAAEGCDTCRRHREPRGSTSGADQDRARRDEPEEGEPEQHESGCQ